MKDLERQALTADREAVREILSRLPPSDHLGKLSFNARLAEIEAQLATLAAEPATSGSVALMFGGGPVLGSRAIDAGFASEALQTFRDLVLKKVARDEIGRLGSRGKIPLRSEVNLAITDLVRGSVGFVLEECGPNSNHEIADTTVKSAIDEVTRIIVSTGGESQDEFESAIESLDSRLLISLRDFFRVLDEKRASVRIVENERDAQLDVRAVTRGRRRVDMIEITEEESESIVGELLGLLPESRRFEMRLSDNGQIIKGTVSAALTPTYISWIETPGRAPVGRTWRVKMRVREVRERNKAPRKLYTLIGLLEQMS